MPSDTPATQAAQEALYEAWGAQPTTALTMVCDVLAPLRRAYYVTVGAFAEDLADPCFANTLAENPLKAALEVTHESEWTIYPYAAAAVALVTDLPLDELREEHYRALGIRVSSDEYAILLAELILATDVLETYRNSQGEVE